MTNAVSSMVFPSPFRPVPSQAVPGSTDWAPDGALMVSADVTAQEPFTVSYKIQNQASWSDGAPIAAEDFRYLWQQMITQPGVVDPAYYRLISDVNSSEGGKSVTVTFREPYPAWRQLFTDLLAGASAEGLARWLPARPGGGARSDRSESDLRRAVPGQAGRFRSRGDPARTQRPLLEHPGGAGSDPAAARRDHGAAGRVAALGDAQMALVRGGTATQAQLQAIPAVRTSIMPQARELQLALNGRTGDLTDPRVRHAVLGLLDPTLLATVAAQTGSWMEPARAQVLSPSDPGYAPTAPPRPSTDEAFGLLAEAGYARAPEQPVSNSSPTSPAPQPRQVAKNGKTLAVRIGAVDKDTTALAVANTAADMLRSAGIDASVRSLPAEELYGKELLDGNVDAIVGWDRAGNDPATVLASRFGCPPAAEATPDGPSSSQLEEIRKAPSNISGVCDPALQPAIDTALRGIDVPKVVGEAEPKLWELGIVLPIMQDNGVAAASSRMDGVS